MGFWLYLAISHLLDLLLCFLMPLRPGKLVPQAFMRATCLLAYLLCLRYVVLYVPPLLSPPTLTRSEPCIVSILAIDAIETVTILFFVLNIIILLLIHSDYMFRVKYIRFDTPLNMLHSQERKTILSPKLCLTLLILLYITIFDYYMIALIPHEILKFRLRHKSRFMPLCRLVIFFHCGVTETVFRVCNGSMCFIRINLLAFFNYPYEAFALWYTFLCIVLSEDVHPNPGPAHVTNSFTSGFLSFCNWNLNTLSKDDFYRKDLLEAHITL